MRGPNMSYCAFENTASAIDQLLDMLGDAIDEGEPMSMSTYEQMAYNRMRKLTKRLNELMDQYDDVVAAAEETE